MKSKKAQQTVQHQINVEITVIGKAHQRCLNVEV